MRNCLCWATRASSAPQALPSLSIRAGTGRFHSWTDHTPAKINSTGRFDIYVQKLGEKKARLLAKGPGGYYGVAGWSPDDRFLLLRRADSNFNQDLFLVDVATGARLQMSSVLGYSPHTAGRYTGIGNTAFAVLAATAICRTCESPSGANGCGCDPFRNRHRGGRHACHLFRAAPASRRSHGENRD